MEYRNLGRSGLRVSRLCLGMMSYGTSEWRQWVLDYDESRPFIERALDAGINFFDSADTYSKGESERVLGRAIAELGVDREAVVIATKCFNGTHDMAENRWGLSRKHVHAACEASLQRLGTDYIDLYQIHAFDDRTPIDETIDALSDLVRTGKVRYLGASNLAAWQLAKYLYTADARGGVRFISMQNHVNLLWREEEREMLPYCLDEGIGVIPWSPLARGWLTRTADRIDETTRGKNDPMSEWVYRNASRDVIGRNAEVAERLGVAPAQTALAWLLAKKAVTAPIIGATKMQHLDDAVAALDLELSDEDIEALEEPYAPQWFPRLV